MSTQRWIPPSMRQTWASLPGILIKMTGGMCLGFTSCFLAAIREPDSDIKMDIHTSSWFVSSLAISFIFSFFLGCFTMSRFGRRVSIMVCSVPGIVGQFTIYFASDAAALLVGRVLTGVSVGSVALVGVVTIAEATSPRNRGMFLTMPTVSLNVGSLIAHAVGHYASWRTLTIIITIPMILIFITAYTSPESPSWLAERKQYEKSREAFYWLRGRTEDSTREIEELIRAQQHKTVDKTSIVKIENVRDIFLKFKKKNFINPLLVSFAATVLMEASGRHLFPSYAAQLIKEMMTGEGFNAYYYNIVLDISIIASGLSSSYLVRIMKTRTLLFSTGAATAAVLALACLSLYLVKSGLIPEDYSIIPLALFGLFFLIGNTGCTCIPLVLHGELFPLEHRAVATLLTCILSASLMTFFLKIMPYVVGAWHVHGAFGVLCACVVAMLVVLYFTLPETKGRTLQEIEDYFTRGRFRDGAAVPADDEHLMNSESFKAFIKYENNNK